MAAEQTVQIAVCERHGLKYNAASETGCVRCRRDTAAVAAAPVSRADGAASAPLQILLAALLVGGTGALFCSAQQAMVDGYALLQRTALRGETAAAPDGAGRSVVDSGSPVDGAQPSPTDGVAVGPAEEQRQMKALLQQLQSARARAAHGAQSANEPPE